MAELKTFLQALGAKTSGAKAELIQRLSILNREAGRSDMYVPVSTNQSMTMEREDEDNEEEATAESQ